MIPFSADMRVPARSDRPSARGVTALLVLALLLLLPAGPGLAQGSCPKSFSKTDIVSSVRFPAQVNLRAIDHRTGFAYLVYPDLARGHQKMSRIDLSTGQEVAVLDLVNVPTSGSLLPTFITVIVDGKIYLPGQPGVWVYNVTTGNQVDFLGQESLRGMTMITAKDGLVYGYRRSGGVATLSVIRASDRALIHVGAVPASLTSVSGLAVSPDGQRIAVGLVDRVHLLENRSPYPIVATRTLADLNLQGTGAAFHRLVFAGNNHVYVTATDREDTESGPLSVSYLVKLDHDGVVRGLKPLQNRNDNLPYLGLGAGAGSVILADGTVYEASLPRLDTVGSVPAPEENFQYNSIAFTDSGARAVLFARDGGIIVEGFASEVTLRINGEGALAEGFNVLVGDRNRIEICSASDPGASYAVLASSSIDRTLRLPSGQFLPIDPQGILPPLTVVGTLDASGSAGVEFSVPSLYQGMSLYYTVMIYDGSLQPPTRDELDRIRNIFPRSLRVNVLAND